MTCYREDIKSDDLGCFLEIETYGGGPAGGYRIRCNGLYEWHQEWHQYATQQKISGTLFRRPNRDNNEYFEVKHAD